MFTPLSGIPVAKLAIIAKATGQNVGAIDDHCRFLQIDEAMIDADPMGVADDVSGLMDELQHGGCQ